MGVESYYIACWPQENFCLTVSDNRGLISGKIVRAAQPWTTRFNWLNIKSGHWKHVGKQGLSRAKYLFNHRGKERDRGRGTLGYCEHFLTDNLIYVKNHIFGWVPCTPASWVVSSHPQNQHTTFSPVHYNWTKEGLQVVLSHLNLIKLLLFAQNTLTSLSALEFAIPAFSDHK